MLFAFDDASSQPILHVGVVVVGHRIRWLGPDITVCDAERRRDILSKQEQVDRRPAPIDSLLFLQEIAGKGRPRDDVVRTFVESEPADVLYPFGYQREPVRVGERRRVFSHNKHMQPIAFGSGGFNQKSMSQRERIRIQDAYSRSGFQVFFCIRSKSQYFVIAIGLFSIRRTRSGTSTSG